MKHIKDLLYGQNKSCGNIAKGYRQQIVLVNKSDIATWGMETDVIELVQGMPLVAKHNVTSTLKEGKFAKHNVTFTLKEGKSGYLIQGNPNSSVITPNWTQKSSDVARYAHSIQFAAFGVSEQDKYFLSQLNTANYFAAVLHNSGIVEIYGWEFGMQAGGYTYDGGDGGALVTLESIEDEFYSPFVYKSPFIGGEIPDFEALFNIDDSRARYKAFNNDYNNGFTS